MNILVLRPIASHVPASRQQAKMIARSIFRHISRQEPALQPPICDIALTLGKALPYPVAIGVLGTRCSAVCFRRTTGWLVQVGSKLDVGPDMWKR